ncbi:Olfactory receptor 139, partial [Lemmus lemmus]
SVTKFILLGLTGNVRLQLILFVVFFFAYIVTTWGNFSILAAIFVEPKLHIPIYYFLGEIYLCWTLGASVSLFLSMLVRFLIHQCRVPYTACFSHLLAGVDCHLLTTMAYDCYLPICQPLTYMAVCRPLHYGAVMTPWRCLALVAASWAVAHLHSLLHTLLISALSYPSSAPVHHFFCDMTMMLSLATSDTSVAETAIFSEGLAVVLTPLLLVSLSYSRILLAVLGVRTTGGRRRAFSTCGAHLVVVSLFFGSVLSVYFRPSSTYSARYDRLASVVYAVVTPTLNPFIYSLRNKEVKGAIKRGFRWTATPQDE